MKLTDEHKSSVQGWMAIQEHISQLHVECHWLMQCFDVRKQARAGEIEALGMAKAEPSGADSTFVQTKSVKFTKPTYLCAIMCVWIEYKDKVEDLTREMLHNNVMFVEMEKAQNFNLHMLVAAKARSQQILAEARPDLAADRA